MLHNKHPYQNLKIAFVYKNRKAGKENRFGWHKSMQIHIYTHTRQKNLKYNK